MVVVVVDPGKVVVDPGKVLTGGVTVMVEMEVTTGGLPTITSSAVHKTSPGAMFVQSRLTFGLFAKRRMSSVVPAAWAIVTQVSADSTTCTT